jgi:hypothetical protein
MVWMGSAAMLLVSNTTPIAAHVAQCRLWTTIVVYSGVPSTIISGKARSVVCMIKGGCCLVCTYRSVMQQCSLPTGRPGRQTAVR